MGVAFYRGWFVVVHSCSIFSLRRQMEPLQSIKFQTADFPTFWARITVIFSATCIGRGVFSVAIMGNVMHILSVLQWLEVVIVFVFSLFIYLFIYSFIHSFIHLFSYLLYHEGSTKSKRTNTKLELHITTLKKPQCGITVVTNVWIMASVMAVIHEIG